ncbi:hypothetical protein MBLNU230_g4770t1 [Neophaeotheca triangularis]
MEQQKPVNTLVLDTGAIIRNEPSVSTLIGQSENLITVPAIISEIKDATTRTRVGSTLMPFLTLRTPNPTSVKFVTDFARRTGDLAVLSKPDIQIIALTYEIECERNQGDWRLRRTPGQKGMNGSPPEKGEAKAEATAQEQEVAKDDSKPAPVAPWAKPMTSDNERPTHIETETPKGPVDEIKMPEPAKEIEAAASNGDDERDGGAALTNAPSITEKLADTTLDDTTNQPGPFQPTGESQQASQETPQETNTPRLDITQNSTSNPPDDIEDDHSSDDGGGWITPSNLKKKQAIDSTGSSKLETTEPKTMQAAVLTTDYAMQNVILQIGLNLLSPTLHRVKHLKTFVLRCHACFTLCKDMSKQFCTKCGKPTLTRVTCSTSANGEFRLHLKKNMQWNNKGEKYSIPKPVHGSANGRVRGGGKGHWGNELILAEDQKEYQRAVTQEKKTKERGLMDEDYLPGILTGDRGKAGGRIKVGAGRNVNARKR